MNENNNESTNLNKIKFTISKEEVTLIEEQVKDLLKNLSSKEDLELKSKIQAKIVELKKDKNDLYIYFFIKEIEEEMEDLKINIKDAPLTDTYLKEFNSENFTGIKDGLEDQWIKYNLSELNVNI